MDELQGVAAAHALAARAGGVAGAEKELAEPDGESLFADAAASLDEETRGEGRLGGAFRESAAEGVVAEERDEGHARNIGRERAGG